MITLDGIIFSYGNTLGGVSVYFRELLRQAVLAGEDVQILVHNNRIAATDLNCGSRQIIFRAPRLLERVRSLYGLPSGLLHSSYYRTSPQAEIGNVVTVYDFTYEKFSGGLRGFFHTHQKRNAILRSDAVICISENTRRDLQEFVPEYPSERAFVTHLAASDIFRPIENSRCGLTSQPFVLFVGGRAGYKNFVSAVRAVQIAREFALVCVGGGPFTADEHATLKKTVDGRHFHAGPIDSAALNELYNAAVCLIYPSLYEGFGIPPLEAMKAGCPFVALNRSSIPEVAGDAGILVESSDPELLAIAITNCAQSTQRETLRVLGLERASQFSWKRTFVETSSIYQQVLKNMLV